MSYAASRTFGTFPLNVLLKASASFIPETTAVFQEEAHKYGSNWEQCQGKRRFVFVKY